MTVSRHKHGMIFRFLRFLKICGDHVSDDNKCIYDIYMNPYNPLSWVVVFITVISSVIFYGLFSLKKIKREIMKYFKNYKKD